MNTTTTILSSLKSPGNHLTFTKSAPILHMRTPSLKSLGTTYHFVEPWLSQGGYPIPQDRTGSGMTCDPCPFKQNGSWDLH